MEKFCVVTTSHRGVFVGKMESQYEPGTTQTCVLRDARMAIYWGGTRGVLRLSGIGPEEGDRISSQCPRLTIEGVTAIMECTDAASERWSEYTHD